MTKALIQLRIAWLSLLEHRRRTLLVGGAIAVVTCLFILLSALSAGMDRTLKDAAVTLITGHLNVNGIVKTSPGQALPLLSNYEQLIPLIQREIPELDFVVQRGRGSARVVGESNAMDASVTGIEIAKEPSLRRLLAVKSGRLDDLAQPRTVVIFERDAQTLGLTVGDVVTLSTETLRGSVNTLDCRVVAIARDVGLLSGGAVFTSMDSLRILYQVRPNVTGSLQMHLEHDEAADLPQIAERLRKALQKAGYRVGSADPRVFIAKLDAATRKPWTGEMLDVSTWPDEVSPLMWSHRALRALSTLLIVILLLITAAGITNSLWIATRERTREIGALRAMGMQRSGVARLFLLEAGLLGFLASMFGCAAGIGIAQGLNVLQLQVPDAVQLFVMRDTVRLLPEPATLFFAVALMSGTSCVAALFPALRAASLRPIEAMAHFG